MKSKLAFFSAGLTKASFRSCRKISVCMDSFTIEANNSAIDGNASLSIVVGIGLSSQLVLGDCFMSFISPTDNSLNCVKLGGLLLSSAMMVHGWMALRFSLTFIILVINKLLNCPASSSLVCPGGRGRSCFLSRMPSHILKIFFKS